MTDENKYRDIVQNGEDAPDAVPRADEAMLLNLQLPKKLVTILEEFARRLDFSVPVLVNRWLDDRIRHERDKLKRVGHTIYPKEFLSRCHRAGKYGAVCTLCGVTVDRGALYRIYDGETQEGGFHRAPACLKCAWVKQCEEAAPRVSMGTKIGNSTIDAEAPTGQELKDIIEANSVKGTPRLGMDKLMRTIGGALLSIGVEKSSDLGKMVQGFDLATKRLASEGVVRICQQADMIRAEFEDGAVEEYSQMEILVGFDPGEKTNG